MSYSSYRAARRDGQIFSAHDYGTPIMGGEFVTGEARLVRCNASGELYNVAKVDSVDAGVTGTYSTAAGSATGASAVMRYYRTHALYLEFGAVTGNPSSVGIQWQESDDGSSWYNFGSLTSIASATIGSGLSKVWHFDSPAEYIRLVVTTSGIGAGDAVSIDTSRITTKS